MAITRLNNFARVDKNFSPMESSAFDAVDLKYDGFQVETLKDKSKKDVDEFIDILNEFATTIASITSAGISSTNIDGAIGEFKGQVQSCSNAIGDACKTFESKVIQRLEQMSDAERRAYQTAGGASKFGESVRNSVGNFLDKAASQISEKSISLENWAKQNKSQGIK